MRELVNVLFDGTFDGLLTIVHAHYYDKLEPDYISEKFAYQQTVGTIYTDIETDIQKSGTVFDALHKKISPDAASTVYRAFLYFEEARFLHIYNYILLGFKVGADVDRHMKTDCVTYTQQCAKRAGHEAHKLTGFCRFVETKDKVLYCKIGPDCNVLEIIANHFADRLMNEQWIIHDEKRAIAAVYDGNEYMITDVPDTVSYTESEDEAAYKDLWHSFFDTIAIKNKINYKLQRQNLPLRYRKYMHEFKR